MEINNILTEIMDPHWNRDQTPDDVVQCYSHKN